MPRLTFFFFHDTAPTEIYTLSLHDALPISSSTANTCAARAAYVYCPARASAPAPRQARRAGSARSEEHTSELQSRRDLVCRLLLEKKNNEAIMQITRVEIAICSIYNHIML